MSAKVKSLTDIPEWHDQADLLVVGAGAAGASAAIEAASQGASVRLYDRLAGGGASALSGGVVYAGGGTKYQQAAKQTDDVDNMLRYLQQETQGIVSDETLKRFCIESAANLTWLESFGVQFDATCFDDKTSYPPDGYFLYYSGNELSAPYRHHASPARRGHRTLGKGLTGRYLYQGLLRGLNQAEVQLESFTEVTALIQDEQQNIVGLEIFQTSQSRLRRNLLSWLNNIANKLVLASPKMMALIRGLVHKLRAKGETRYIKAHRGVVLASGGFMFNNEMLELYAPKHLGLRALGEFCNGAGIQLGQAAGGQLAHMEKVSAWRFITPPSCLLKGVIIDPQGKRFCPEDLYGATSADIMMQHSDGKAWLIIDSKIMTEAKQAARPFKVSWTQWMPARLFLHAASIKANTLSDLAKQLAIDPNAIEATIAKYNQGYAADNDEFDKLAKYQQPLTQGPYYAIDISPHNKTVPCPSMTLGGLVVNELSGQVLDKQGSEIGGLYAAGRAAVGICSNGYISGLSLADCIFSGRRVGRAITAQLGIA